MEVPEAWAALDRLEVLAPPFHAVLGGRDLGPWEGPVPYVALRARVPLREGPRLRENLDDEALREVRADLLRGRDEDVALAGIPGGLQGTEALDRDEGREPAALVHVVEEAVRRADEARRIDDGDDGAAGHGEALLRFTS
jgi:hypothetical protein